MSNDVKVSDSKMDQMVVYQVGDQEVKLSPNMIKNFITKGNEEITAQEAIMFMNLCKFNQLNPFTMDAFLVKFKGSPAQMITGKEAYMKRAFEHPKYNGLRAGIIVLRGSDIVEMEGAFCLKDDVLLGGWAEVYVKGIENPYCMKVDFAEYNKGQALWKDKPKTMIRKVALVQALREAFPDRLSGLYTDDEMADNNYDIPMAQVENEIAEAGNSQIIDTRTDLSVLGSDDKEPAQQGIDF